MLAILSSLLHPKASGYMGSSQTYGPLLAMNYIAAPNISGYQHDPNFGNYPYSTPGPWQGAV